MKDEGRIWKETLELKSKINEEGNEDKEDQMGNNKIE